MAAGDRDVFVMGGGRTIAGCLAAGLLDQLRIHLSPEVLGAGTPLFDAVGRHRLRQVKVETSPSQPTSPTRSFRADHAGQHTYRAARSYALCRRHHRAKTLRRWRSAFASFLEYRTRGPMPGVGQAAQLAGPQGRLPELTAVFDQLAWDDGSRAGSGCCFRPIGVK